MKKYISLLLALLMALAIVPAAAGSAVCCPAGVCDTCSICSVCGKYTCGCTTCDSECRTPDKRCTGHGSTGNGAVVAVRSNITPDELHSSFNTLTLYENDAAINMLFNNQVTRTYDPGLSLSETMGQRLYIAARDQNKTYLLQTYDEEVASGERLVLNDKLIEMARAMGTDRVGYVGKESAFYTDTATAKSGTSLTKIGQTNWLEVSNALAVATADDIYSFFQFNTERIFTKGSGNTVTTTDVATRWATGGAAGSQFWAAYEKNGTQQQIILLSEVEPNANSLEKVYSEQSKFVLINGELVSAEAARPATKDAIVGAFVTFRIPARQGTQLEAGNGPTPGFVLISSPDGTPLTAEMINQVMSMVDYTFREQMMSAWEKGAEFRVEEGLAMDDFDAFSIGMLNALFDKDAVKAKYFMAKVE